LIVLALLLISVIQTRRRLAVGTAIARVVAWLKFDSTSSLQLFGAWGGVVVKALRY